MAAGTRYFTISLAEIMIIIEELYSKNRFYDTTFVQIMRIFYFDDESF
jgi:hypothetical protein